MEFRNVGKNARNEVILNVKREGSSKFYMGREKSLPRFSLGCVLLENALCHPERSAKHEVEGSSRVFRYLLERASDASPQRLA